MEEEKNKKDNFATLVEKSLENNVEDIKITEQKGNEKIKYLDIENTGHSVFKSKSKKSK